jgi:hypothetical protein
LLVIYRYSPVSRNPEDTQRTSKAVTSVTDATFHGRMTTTAGVATGN